MVGRVRGPQALELPRAAGPSPRDRAGRAPPPSPPRGARRGAALTAALLLAGLGAGLPLSPRAPGLDAPPPAPADEVAEERLGMEVPEILASLALEMEALEARMRALQARVGRLREDVLGRGAAQGAEEPWPRRSWIPDPLAEEVAERTRARPSPDGGSPEAPGGLEPPWLEGDEARLHERLRARIEDLVERHRGLTRLLDLAGPREGERPEWVEEVERSREGVQAELHQVLLGVLDLRDRGRQAQLDRLRAELGALQEALERRRDEAARRSMVEARLRELLGEDPAAGGSPGWDPGAAEEEAGGARGERGAREGTGEQRRGGPSSGEPRPLED